MWTLAFQPGIEPMPPIVKSWCLNHWTAGEVLRALSWRLCRKKLRCCLSQPPFCVWFISTASKAGHPTPGQRVLQAHPQPQPQARRWIPCLQKTPHDRQGPGATWLLPTRTMWPQWRMNVGSPASVHPCTQLPMLCTWPTTTQTDLDRVPTSPVSWSLSASLPQTWAKATFYCSGCACPFHCAAKVLILNRWGPLMPFYQ